MMDKQKIKITAVFALALIVVFELIYILKVNSDAVSRQNVQNAVQQGEVLYASKSYQINNKNIPAYEIGEADGVYFTGSDLKLFGFECNLSEKGYVLSHASDDFSLSSASYVQGLENEIAEKANQSFVIGENIYSCYVVKKDILLIPETVLAGLGEKLESENTVYYAFGSEEMRAECRRITEIEIKLAEGKATEIDGATADATNPNKKIVEGEISDGKRIIVIDPGHGKSSSRMSAEEKAASGWVQNSKGAWGEWRHYKIGSSTVNCEGSGCNGRVTPNGACWYPIGNGDRNIEPELNMNNALAAKKYLEEMGYEVRLTRQSNEENPSITRRLSYCHPNNDTTQAPDADLFLCIHSNAAGGSATGTAYISLEAPYDQKWISDTYVEDSNRLGKLCNDSIADNTSLNLHGNGIISFEPELIAFCKSPVPCGYLEIGFFDNKSELAMMQAECDGIGKAIALGIDRYFEEG